jgi:hypothetical protein
MSFKKICGLSFLLALGTFGFVEGALAVNAGLRPIQSIFVDSDGTGRVGNLKFPHIRDSLGDVVGVWTNDNFYTGMLPREVYGAAPEADAGLAQNVPQRAGFIIREDGAFGKWIEETSYVKQATSAKRGKVILANRLGITSGQVSHIPKEALVGVWTLPVVVQDGTYYASFDLDPEIREKAELEFRGIALIPRLAGPRILVSIPDIQAKFK